MSGLGHDRVDRSPAEAGLPVRAVRVVPEAHARARSAHRGRCSEEGVRLDAGPHDVGVVGVGRQLPDALERSVGVARERQRPLGALGPRAPAVGARLDRRAPVPRLDAREHRRSTLARVDGDGRDLAHEEVRALEGPLPTIGAARDPEPLARADGDDGLGHVDSVHYVPGCRQGAGHDVVDRLTGRACVCTCRRTSAMARGRIARVAPPTCGVMRTPGVVHSGWPSRQRLRIGDVECRSQSPGGALGDERLGVDHRPPGHVDEERAIRHTTEHRRVEESARRIGERHDDDDDVVVRQQVGQLVDAVDLRHELVAGPRPARRPPSGSPRTGANRRAIARPICPYPTTSTRLSASAERSRSGSQCERALRGNEVRDARGSRTTSASAPARPWTRRGRLPRCTGSPRSGSSATNCS